MKRIILCLSLVLACRHIAAAQELLEGVAAQVGTELVFLSEVEERAYLIRLQNTKVPGSPSDADRRKALDELINERILRVYAREHQIQASDREISDAVDRAIGDVKSSFATTREFASALEAEGLTEADLRENYRKEIADKLVRDRVIAKEIYDQVEVSRKEVQDYYRKHQEQLGKTDRVFVVERLTVPIPMIATEELRARRELLKLHEQITGPTDFSAAAREYTDDEGTRNRGGDLGWVREEALVDEIRDIVTSLNPGQMSAVSRTRFGLHLFYVDERKNDTLHLFHILKKVGKDTKEEERIKSKLRLLFEQYSNGEMTWSELENEFPERDEDASGKFEYRESEMPAVIREWLVSAAVGEQSPVFESATTLLALRVESIRGGKNRPLGELYPRIEEELRVQKLDQEFSKWIAERRQEVYIRIIPSDFGESP